MEKDPLEAEEAEPPSMRPLLARISPVIPIGERATS